VSTPIGPVATQGRGFVQGDTNIYTYRGTAAYSCAMKTMLADRRHLQDYHAHRDPCLYGVRRQLGAITTNAVARQQMVMINLSTGKLVELPDA